MIYFCIFFVTSRCNSGCRHCFYRRKLNRGGDLSLEEIGKIVSRLGSVPSVLFSGGEPFLREDIADVARLFIREGRTSHLAIPTNGLETAAILSVTRRILEMPGEFRFSVNFSLDGTEGADAVIRGRQDAFTRCLSSMEQLSAVRKEYPRLRILVNSVYTGENGEELRRLIRFVDGLGYVDYHHIEPMRPEELSGYPQINLDVVELRRIQLLAATLYEKRVKECLRRISNPLLKLKESARHLAWMGHLRYAQAIQEEFLSKRKTDLFRCLAGKGTCVIESDGEVKLCELLPVAGSLREHGYDLKAVLASEKARSLRGMIDKGCSCTHFCFISDCIRAGVMRLNPVLLTRLAVHYARFKTEQRGLIS